MRVGFVLSVLGSIRWRMLLRLFRVSCVSCPLRGVLLVVVVQYVLPVSPVTI